MKTCTKCGDPKELTDFSKNKNKKDGLDIWCKDCKKTYHKNYYLKNKDKLNKNAIEYVKNNPEKRKVIAKKWYDNHTEQATAIKKNWVKNNPEKVKTYALEYYNINSIKIREYSFKRTYGITFADLEQMKFKQDWCCKTCGINESDLLEMTGKGLFLDHDHKTGVIRGLLCQDCNIGLGGFRDNIESLKRAIKYLGGSID